MRGLIPRIVEQIFASIMSADVTIEYTVKVSYMEIYMERIKDLLAREFVASLRVAVPYTYDLSWRRSLKSAGSSKRQLVNP